MKLQTLSVVFLSILIVAGSVNSMAETREEVSVPRLKVSPVALKTMLSAVGSDELCVDRSNSRYCAVTVNGEPIAKRHVLNDEVPALRKNSLLSRGLVRHATGKLSLKSV